MCNGAISVPPRGEGSPSFQTGLLCLLCRALGEGHWGRNSGILLQE